MPDVIVCPRPGFVKEPDIPAPGAFLALLPPEPPALPLALCTAAYLAYRDEWREARAFLGRCERDAEARRRAHWAARAPSCRTFDPLGYPATPTLCAVPVPPRPGFAPHDAGRAWHVPSRGPRRPQPRQLFDDAGEATDAWAIKAPFAQRDTSPTAMHALGLTGLCDDLRGFGRDLDFAREAYRDAVSADAQASPGGQEFQARRDRWCDEDSDREWPEYTGPTTDPDEDLIDLNQDFAVLHREYQAVQRRIARIKRGRVDLHARKRRPSCIFLDDEDREAELARLRQRLIDIRLLKAALIEEGRELKLRRKEARR